MTESNANLSKTDFVKTSGNSLVLPAIISIGFVAVGLSIMLFMTVNSHLRSMDERENQLKVREIAIEANEARREILIKEINQFNISRQNALTAKEESERNAADMQVRLKERNSIAREIDTLNEQKNAKKIELGDLTVKINSLKSEEEQIGNLVKQRRFELNSTDESTTKRREYLIELEKKITSLRNDLINSEKLQTASKFSQNDLDKKIDEFARITSLLSAKSAEINNMRAIETSNKASAQQAEKTRLDEEKKLIAIQAELNRKNEQLALTNAALLRKEELIKETNADEATAQQARAARVATEKDLADAKAELSSIQDQLSENRKHLKNLQDQFTILSNSKPSEK